MAALWAAWEFGRSLPIRMMAEPADLAGRTESRACLMAGLALIPVAYLISHIPVKAAGV